ncbi:MAG TPA: MoaD/ThiS family protein [Actinomycetota bacterium]|jgi:molybdopterin synthase sulfur carrier subunit|nr:MoaD/ThiS family protein [Actinomycetota bacterium]
MSVKVRIPTPLRKLTKDRAEVEADGGTIRAIVDDLEKQFPGFKERMCDEQGELRRFVNVYVGEEDIRFLDGLETEIPQGELVSIIPAVAGGSP